MGQVKMIDEYERYMRSVKRGVIKAMGYEPEFTKVVISWDIAAVMLKNVAQRAEDGEPYRAEIGTDTTWETVPLTVDPDLPRWSVIYIWKEDKQW
jgi:hypothetical protein